MKSPLWCSKSRMHFIKENTTSHNRFVQRTEKKISKNWGVVRRLWQVKPPETKDQSAPEIIANQAAVSYCRLFILSSKLSVRWIIRSFSTFETLPFSDTFPLPPLFEESPIRQLPFFLPKENTFLNLDAFFELLDLELLMEVWSSVPVTIAGFPDWEDWLPLEEDLPLEGRLEGGLAEGQADLLTVPWGDLFETVVVGVFVVPWDPEFVEVVWSVTVDVAAVSEEPFPVPISLLVVLVSLSSFCPPSTGFCVACFSWFLRQISRYLAKSTAS